MKTYHKTVFQVEILSEDEYHGNSLDDMHFDVTNGECSGITKMISKTTMTSKEVADALKKQGSDPEFFRLNEDGTEMEE